MMCSLIILLHQESFIMEANNKQPIVIVTGGRSGGKSVSMQRAMFETKETIAIMTHNGIRFSEWANAEEIE